MMLREEVLRDLVCPACRQPLALTDASHSPSAGLEGVKLRCPACAAVYPVADRVAYFAGRLDEQEQTAASFGFQWKAFWTGRFDSNTVFGVDLKDTANYVLESLGLTAPDVRGAKILDAGTGSGRVPISLQDMGCHVYAVDLHRSLDVVADRMRNLDNVSFFQADLLNLPFSDGYFDAVWCSGVLHHVPHIREAFRSIASKTKPGGRLFVSVYSTAPHHYRIFRHLLPFAHRLPPAMNYVVSSVLALPLYVAFNSTGLLIRATRRNQTPPYRILGFSIAHPDHKSYSSIRLNLFDQLHPRFQSEHSVSEVREWFESNGFGEIVVTESEGMVGIRGTRGVG